MQTVMDSEDENLKELGIMRERVDAQDIQVKLFAEKLASTMQDIQVDASVRERQSTSGDVDIQQLERITRANDACMASLTEALEKNGLRIDAIQESVTTQKGFLEGETTRLNSRIDNWCELTLKQVKELQAELRNSPKTPELSELQREIQDVKGQLSAFESPTGKVADSSLENGNGFESVEPASPSQVDKDLFGAASTVVRPLNLPTSPSGTQSMPVRPSTFSRYESLPNFPSADSSASSTAFRPAGSHKLFRSASPPVSRQSSLAGNWRGSPRLPSRTPLFETSPEEDEENARQAYLARIPVQLRKAISEHPRAQPWQRLSWVERLKVAEELSPSLDESSSM